MHGNEAFISAAMDWLAHNAPQVLVSNPELLRSFKRPVNVVDFNEYRKRKCK